MSVTFTAAASEKVMYEFWFTSHGGNLTSDLISLEGARSFFQQSGQPTETLTSLIRLTNRSKDLSSMNFVDFCAASNLLLQLSRKHIDGLPSFLPTSFWDQVHVFAPMSKKSTLSEVASTNHPNPATTSTSISSNDFGSASLSTMINPTSSGYPHSMDSKSFSPGIDPFPNATMSSNLNTSFASSSSSTTTGGASLSSSTTTTTTSPSASSSFYLPPRSSSSLSPTPATNTLSAMTFLNSKENASNFSTISRSNVDPASFTNESNSGWGVPEEKRSHYGSFFDTLDSAKKGFVTGAECFNLFVKSGLPQSELSKIWCLVTFDGVPQLKKDDFIVAMHLINEKLAGKSIPAVLPSDLLPLSRRPGLKLQKDPSFDFSFTSRAPPSSSSSLSSNDSILSMASITATPSLKPTPRVSLGMDDLLKSPSSFSTSEEVKDLSQKTEHLTLQRMDFTHQVNTLSIEKQNLTIQLGQVKAAHDAETSLLNTLKSTVEQEKLNILNMKEELQSLEQQRQQFIVEKQDLLLAQQRYKTEAEQLRHRIAHLNTEIQSMRVELNQIQSVIQKDQDNHDFFKQTYMNVNETKQRYQQQLKESPKESFSFMAHQGSTTFTSSTTSPTTLSTTGNVTTLSPLTSNSLSTAFPSKPTSTLTSFATSTHEPTLPSTTTTTNTTTTVAATTTSTTSSSTLSPSSLPMTSTLPSSHLNATIPPEYQKDFDQFNWDFPPLSPSGTVSTSTTPAAKPVPMDQSTTTSSTSASVVPPFDPFATTPSTQLSSFSSTSVQDFEPNWPSSTSTDSTSVSTTTAPSTTHDMSTTTNNNTNTTATTTSTTTTSTTAITSSTMMNGPSSSVTVSTSELSAQTQLQLQNLLSLGFAQASAMEAIQKYPNDLARATDYLLDLAENK